MKIHKDDNVIVMSGKDKGKKGKVLKIFRDNDRILVEGVNIHKKHKKSVEKGKPGSIVDMAMPIHVSNVLIADPKDGKPSRVGYKVDGGKKIRIAKKSGQTI